MEDGLRVYIVSALVLAASDVLILVLMEDGLREGTYYQLRKGRFVLILVLMEDGLRERL